MSVQYKLNKAVRIGDLRNLGLTIEDHTNEEDCHPFVVLNEQGSGVAISKVITNGETNKDNWEIDEFEGRFSHGGAKVMLEICDKLDCKFITDEDIDNVFRDKQNKITEDTFKARTNQFRKLLEEEKEAD